MALVGAGLFESRAKAQEAIAAGLVLVNGQRAIKPGLRVAANACLEADAPYPWVSRGGVKLAAALSRFGIDPAGKVCLDVGASTGGFTEVLLARGAPLVYAVDVGSGQLHARLRGRADVQSFEQTDIRKLEPSRLPQLPDFATIDVSFISLKLVLPAVSQLLPPQAQIVALIKPQFEAGKAEVDKGRGVITDDAVHQRVIRELQEFVTAQAGLCWRGVVESPLLGPAGNKEFLVLIEKTV